MNLLEEFKKNPGFVYRIGTDYYYIGKWICKPCTDEAVTDCHAMYEIQSLTDQLRHFHDQAS